MRSLTSTDALTAYATDAGAIASDKTVTIAGGGPAAATIASADPGRKAGAARGAVGQDPGPDGPGVPAAPVGRSITVDEAMKQLAASDQAG